MSVGNALPSVFSTQRVSSIPYSDGMSESAHRIWRAGRARATRAVGGGGRLPIASYQSVLTYLAAAGPTPVERLARDLAVPEPRMRGRLVALWDYGFVSAVGGTTWRLTPIGYRLVHALKAESGITARPEGVA